MELELLTREDFLDAALWENMAHDYKVRLPLWRLRCTTGQMRRWLKKLGYSVTYYLESTGERNLREFAKNNPLWPLRAWVALLMEEKYLKEYYKDE